MSYDIAPSVGGCLELEYSETTYGNRHALRLAVAPFDAATFLYTGQGTTSPGEAGLADTFTALGRLWAPYYPPIWTLRLVGVYLNQNEQLQPLGAAPTTVAVPGSFGGSYDVLRSVKRRLKMFSLRGRLWSVWLLQIPASPMQGTVQAGVDTGGYDVRDQAWYAYASGLATGLVAGDGYAFQPGGRVRGWWDKPLAPVVPYVYGG